MRVVSLQRVANSFGIVIVEINGGKGVTVGAVTPGGAADQSHKINIGDRILKVPSLSAQCRDCSRHQVNNLNTLNENHATVKNAIVSSGDVLTLTVAREVNAQVTHFEYFGPRNSSHAD